MAKTFAVFAAAIALVASETSDVQSLDEDALSLLQTRVQKHVINEEGAEEGTLSDGSVVRLGADGGVCAEDEDIGFTKCVEIGNRKIISNQNSREVQNKRDLLSDGISPRGCYLRNDRGRMQVVYNDKPLGTGRPGIRPICQVGGGERAAEIEAWGLTCVANAECKKPTHEKLDWNDNLFIPELKVGTRGGVCEEACGLLTMEQCTKAADMGLLDALTPGYKTEDQPTHQPFGARGVEGAIPSGCSVHTGVHGGRAKSIAYFSSYDTPNGAHAKPGTDGDPLVTPSGVGSGWSFVAPVCGVCTTTTTTTTTTIAVDNAAAVGDPHISYGDAKADLCCEGGECQACPPL